MSILMLTFSNVLPETSCYELIYHMKFYILPLQVLLTAVIDRHDWL